MRSKCHDGSIVAGAQAVAAAAALFFGIFVLGPGGTHAFALTDAIPRYNLNAKIELKQPDATTVPKTSWPLLPHETLSVPLPEKPGCYHLVDDSWREIPCTSKEDMKKLIPPVVADTIVSTSHTSGNKPVTTPLQWGAVATALSYPQQSGMTSDSWSIQGNSNQFPCSGCTNGSPFSNSMPGDKGWVQFVYQQSGDNYGGDTVQTSQLCVWNFDLTAACRQVSYGVCVGNGYKSYCVSPFNTGNLSPLTGPGSPSGFSEVVGYVQCGNNPKDPNVGANGCTLWILGYLANAQNPGWYAAAAPDELGLAGNWNSIGGSLYGMGGGAEAVFCNAELATTVVANSCFTSTSPPSNPSSIFTPTQCAPGITADDLTATLASTGGNGTAEYNNLTSSAATFSCTEYDCRLAWLGLETSVCKYTTHTMVTSSENPALYGDSVTLTAAVTSPDGTPDGQVQFEVDGNDFGPLVFLSQGSAKIQETSLSVGNHTVKAYYLGTNLFAQSSGSLQGGQTVYKLQTATRVSSSENPSFYGDPVTLTAAVTSPDGTPTGGAVQFLVDGNNFGSPVPLSGGSAIIRKIL